VRARTPTAVQDVAAVALDYYEGWFDGDAARMGRALHPQLVRRSRSEDTFSVDTISAEEMVAATAAGTGRTRDPGDRRVEISVDHVYDAIATVTVTSAVYVDYLHLVATPEGWKIVNVLWDRIGRA
jgi:hypothetical protein